MEIEIDKVCEKIPKTITLNNILSNRIYRQVLSIFIKDNEIYLEHGLRGELRHLDILNQLFEVKKEYRLPNCFLRFIYIDRSFCSNNSVFFSHTSHDQTDNYNKILSPCFSFNGYTSGPNNEFIAYEQEMKKIFEASKNNPWLERENILMFRGNIVSPHRQKIINDLEAKKDVLKCELKIISVIKQTEPFTELAKYKYQLLLNGHGIQLGKEAGSIRPKYMLATGSICIYINLGNNVREWWMNLDEENFIIRCENVDQAIEKINYFENNPEKALEHLEKQKIFVEKYFNKKTVNFYWYRLLSTYSNNCNFDITSIREFKRSKIITQEQLSSMV